MTWEAGGGEGSVGYQIRGQIVQGLVLGLGHEEPIDGEGQDPTSFLHLPVNPSPCLLFLSVLAS